VPWFPGHPCGRSLREKENGHGKGGKRQNRRSPPPMHVRQYNKSNSIWIPPWSDEPVAVEGCECRTGVRLLGANLHVQVGGHVECDGQAGRQSSRQGNLRREMRLVDFTLGTLFQTLLVSSQSGLQNCQVFVQQSVAMHGRSSQPSSSETQSRRLLCPGW
jgi:hypothetical protein